MQQASKPKASSSVPRVARLQQVRPSSAASTSNNAHANANALLDKSSMDIPKPERRSFKASRATTPDRLQKARGANARPPAELLQAQLNAVQEDLKNAREHLAAIDRDKAQLLHDLSLTRRLADAAHAAQSAAEEALDLERFKSIEREQLAIDLAQTKERDWNARCHAIDLRRAELAAELGTVKDELALAVEATNTARQIADANADKAATLAAEVSRLQSELETKAEEATAIVAKLESEASGLRAELQNAEASRKEEVGRAEQLLHGLKVDIAYAKRAEADANLAAQEWKTKAESLQARLHELSSLNKSNEDSLQSLTSSFDECKSMLQHEQSQVVQLKEKVSSLEKEAREYKECFLETNRRLDVATKESHQLQATIDRLTSQHKLLNEAHQQVVTNEKTVNSQISLLSQDKIRIEQELDGARDERDKAKKAVEDLAAALREVSSEAREAKERVLAKQTELDSAQLQISELKAEMKNAQDRYQLMLDESKSEVECISKTVEKLGSEAKISNDEWASKEAGFVEMIRRSEEEMSSIKSEMSSLMVSLGAAEKQVKELRAERTRLLDKLKQSELTNSEGSSISSTGVQQTADESKSTVGLKDLVSRKEKEVLALNDEVTDLRLRETAALAKANELSKLLAEATAKKAEEEEAAKGTEKSKVLLMKLEMDKLLGSLKAAEQEANAAKDDKAQLQAKLRLLESKMTEANLTAEEEKISSLRLKETLAEKEEELLSIAREYDGLRTREAAAQAKIDELSSLVAEASTARKLAGEYSANGVAAIRSPEKQHNMFRKMICSPMDNVRDDVNSSNRRTQEDEIKHVEVETVIMKQQQQVIVKHGKEEASAMEVKTLENSKIIEDDISKHRDDDDNESSDDEEIESQGDDAAVEQMNGPLIHGPTSSFNKEQHNQHKKKKALLKKFGSLLKKKAHFTKLNSHAKLVS
ncbi:putative WEB family protein At1g65010, chloroplastic [Oryza glaberrima]|uniref:WEB family protein n=2 Tax=Oryza TaxID=4527 RepID=A0A0D3HGY0_9ORYZ|nr:putative WEB family protein At1g65010, chloroplastic [Oryza glaberrima]